MSAFKGIKTTVVPKDLIKTKEEDQQDLEVMKDLILCNLEWYAPAELAGFVREGIVTLDEIKQRSRVDVHWEENDDVARLKRA